MGRSLVVSLLIGCTGIQNRMPGAQFPINNLSPGCIIIVIGLGIILIAIVLGKIAEMLLHTSRSILQRRATAIKRIIHTSHTTAMKHQLSYCGSLFRTVVITRISRQHLCPLILSHTQHSSTFLVADAIRSDTFATGWILVYRHNLCHSRSHAPHPAVFIIHLWALTIERSILAPFCSNQMLNTRLATCRDKLITRRSSTK